MQVAQQNFESHSNIKGSNVKVKNLAVSQAHRDGS
jgi:hypothetical protein